MRRTAILVAVIVTALLLQTAVVRELTLLLASVASGRSTFTLSRKD